MRLVKEDIWFWQFASDLKHSEDAFNIFIRQTMQSRKLWEPRADIYESEQSLIVKVELAGIDPESLNIIVTPSADELIIKGRRNEQDSEHEERLRCCQLEIYYGHFERRIELPDILVDADKIKASYKDGIVKITIPKVLDASGACVKRTLCKNR